jgi:hypothetical protein
MKNVEKQKRKEEKLIMRGIKKVDKKISKIEKKSGALSSPPKAFFYFSSYRVGLLI